MIRTVAEIPEFLYSTGRGGSLHAKTSWISPDVSIQHRLACDRQTDTDTGSSGQTGEWALGQASLMSSTIFNCAIDVSIQYGVGQTVRPQTRGYNSVKSLPIIIFFHWKQCFFVKEYFPVPSFGGNQCKNRHAPIWHFG